MPFIKKTKDNSRATFICELTGSAKELVENTQSDFNEKYFKGRKRIELGKSRAVQLLLEELATIRKAK